MLENFCKIVLVNNYKKDKEKKSKFLRSTKVLKTKRYQRGDLSICTKLSALHRAHKKKMSAN